MLKLTLKHKLLFLVLITLVSISYLGYVSLSNLSEQNASAKRVSDLTATGDMLSTLQLELLSAEKRLEELKPEEADKFLGEIVTLSNRYQSELTEKSTLHSDPELKTKLVEGKSIFTKYSAALTAQLLAKDKLGFDNDSGILKPLTIAANELRDKISVFSMFKESYILSRQLEKEFLIEPSRVNSDKFTNQIKQLSSKIDDAGFNDSFGRYIDAYSDQARQLIIAAEEQAQSQKKLNTIRSSFKEHILNTQEYLKHELLKKARLEAESSTEKTKLTIIIISAILAISISSIVAKIGLSAGLTLRKIISQVNKIAAGDLSKRLKLSNNKADEFYQVSYAVNTMTDDLRTIIEQVSRSQSDLQLQSEDLSEAIHTIAKNNNIVSDQSNHLASATEQISATTEQVASRVQSLQQDSQNAHNAAVNGGSIISDAMEALSDTAIVVEASSQQLEKLQQHSLDIDKVLLIINDLADQTNLLALNAAIEAARAGEAGRGFSVVADEVRTLAESTVKATGEITDTVRAIQHQTASVIDVMNKSTKSIAKVKRQGNEAQEAVKEIESQSLQTLNTSTEITGAVDEVASTTREMAANMDEIARGVEQNGCISNAIVSSAETLKTNAEQMGEMTRKFSYQ